MLLEIRCERQWIIDRRLHECDADDKTSQTITVKARKIFPCPELDFKIAKCAASQFTNLASII